MRKLVQSSYDADPRFARAATRRAPPPQPAPPPGDFRYVEPSRKVYREALQGERSGLAYAAGYAGLAYLFRCSAVTTLLETFEGSSTVAVMFILAWGLCAPVALTLGLRAGYAIDRTKGLRGRLPALTGFTLGLIGTINLCVELLTWLWVVRR